MRTVSFTPALRDEYETLFNTCKIPLEHGHKVESVIDRINTNKATYISVAEQTNIPWFFIASIHNMEASLNFKTHLHNGDPLTARTTHVPSGRPKTGNPPFTWVESAIDSLTFQGLTSNTDWSLSSLLYHLEEYNGWGYRTKHPDVLSPYLWSFSTHYISGKYVADGRWSSTARSDQVGAAVILRRLVEHGYIEFLGQPSPAADKKVIVAYATSLSADPTQVAGSIRLQEWLNSFPGIFVKIDGIPGARTSEAYKKVTGAYLPGDPRA